MQELNKGLIPGGPGGPVGGTEYFILKHHYRWKSGQNEVKNSPSKRLIWEQWSILNINECHLLYKFPWSCCTDLLKLLPENKKNKE